MSTKQSLWQLLVTNPLVQIAAIVTILVGMLSILKDIGKLTMGAWHQVARLYYWNRDRILYRHIEGFPQSRFHDVDGLATALHWKPSKVLQSLHRLKAKRKVRCIDVDESRFGLWGRQD